MKTWLAADCNFQKNPEKKIKNWNEVVSKEDDVLIFGTFSDGSINNEEILNKLNGRKIVVGMKEFDNHKNFFCYIKNLKTEEYIYIILDKEDYDKLKFKNKDIVCARSITEQEKVWQRNTLSISYCDWDDTPIEYNELPKLIENMKIFEKIGEEF